jgi:hypothetical protein
MKMGIQKCALRIANWELNPELRIAPLAKQARSLNAQAAYIRSRSFNSQFEIRNLQFLWGGFRQKFLQDPSGRRLPDSHLHPISRLLDLLHLSPRLKGQYDFRLGGGLRPQVGALFGDQKDLGLGLASLRRLLR